MLSINTNLNAQNASTQISNAQDDVNTASERLTTGLRINTAADDVAGMGLATRLEATSSRTAQYIENAQAGIAMIQTADAALEAQQDIVARMQELAYKAENDTNSTEDLALINEEFQQLALELNRNEQSAEYNGQKLLDGSLNTSIVIGEDDTATAGTHEGAVTIAINDTVALDAIIDVDNATGAVTTSIDLTVDPTDPGGLNSTWEAEVHKPLQDYADALTTSRAQLGAAQNRLEYSTQNLQSYKQNIDASLSDTQDADYALETTNLAKANVLKSASQSMLSQANKDMEDVVNKLLN